MRGLRRHRREIPQTSAAWAPPWAPRPAGRIVFAHRIREQHDHPVPRRRSRDQTQAARRQVSQDPPAGAVFHQVSVDGCPGGAICPGRRPSASHRIHPVGDVLVRYSDYPVAIQDTEEGNRAVADCDRTALTKAQRVAVRLLQSVGTCPKSPQVLILCGHGRTEQIQREGCDLFMHGEVRISHSSVISAEALSNDRPDYTVAPPTRGSAGIWEGAFPPGRRTASYLFIRLGPGLWPAPSLVFTVWQL